MYDLFCGVYELVFGEDLFEFAYVHGFGGLLRLIFTIEWSVCFSAVICRISSCIGRSFTCYVWKDGIRYF